MTLANEPTPRQAHDFPKPKKRLSIYNAGPSANPGVSASTFSIYGESFVGSRDALIAAGIAQDGWFPGDPGQNKTTGKARKGDKDIRIRRRGAVCFEVYDISNGPKVERQRKAEALQANLRRLAKETAALPESAEQYRTWCLGVLNSAYHYVLDNLERKFHGGYKLDSEALQKLAVAIWRIGQDVVRDAAIRYSDDERTKQIAAIRARHTTEDADFKAFMASALSQPPSEL